MKDEINIFMQRIKSLEEMEDNRKSRVADKVRLQQTQVGTTTSRQRGATLGSTSASGQSWSAVVKSAANATPASPTATSSSVSTRSDGIKTPSKNTRSEYVGKRRKLNFTVKNIKKGLL